MLHSNFPQYMVEIDQHGNGGFVEPLPETILNE